MIKLKNILSEAYAWERQEGKSLPTLAEVQAAYQAKMREDANLDPEEEGHVYEEPPYDEEDEDAGYMDEAAKPDFLDLDNDNNKTEPMKKAAADSTADGNYVNKARAKSNLTKKDCSVYGHDASGKSTKLNSTSDVDNPKYKKFTIKTESLKEGMFSDFLQKIEKNTRLAADVLTVITLAKEDKEGNAEEAVQLMMTNHNMSEKEAIEAVALIFKKSFEWVTSNAGGSKTDPPFTVAESFNKRMIGNLKGSEYILSETFKRK